MPAGLERTKALVSGAGAPTIVRLLGLRVTAVERATVTVEIDAGSS